MGNIVRMVAGILILQCSCPLQVGSKRKRVYNPDDMARGASRARQFLQEFAALPLDQLDLKHALQQVSKMRCDLERDAADHPWLQQFF